MLFHKRVIVAKLRDPREDFREVERPIEIRRDPLTGRKCRINVERARRPHQAKRTKEKISHPTNCPFCHPNLEKITPKYPDAMPERICVGRATTFPNLFPFGEFHSVVAFPSFFLEVDGFSPKELRECLEAAFKTFELAMSTRPALRYWYLNWNHLPPAGASIVHPHLQLLATRNPTRMLSELMRKSKQYYQQHKRNYWKELLSLERKLDERYIGSTGDIHWIASFAPTGNKEVLGVSEKWSSLREAKASISDICQGLHKILKGYAKIGVKSFNLSSYSGPCDKKLPFFRLHFRLIARPDPVSLYTADRGFMEIFHHEPVIDTLPETLARELRKVF